MDAAGKDNKVKGGFRPGKRRFRVLVAVLLLFVIAIGAASYYIQTRKNEIATLVLDLIAENYPGEIKYDRISLDHWSTLTDPSIFFDNLVIRDTSSTNHVRLRAKKLNLEVSVEDLLSGMIQIKSAILEGGELQLDNYTPLTTEELQGLPPLLDASAESAKSKNSILGRNTRLEISDLHIEIRHHIKNKLFEFQVNDIVSDIEFTDESIQASTQLDVVIETLGFNLEKGSFVNGARARGTLKSLFDRSLKQVEIPSFPLELNDQVFNTSAAFNFKEVGTFVISLENEETLFAPSMAMLTDGIRNKFSGIDFLGPLSTRTRLEGSFYYRNNPRVRVTFGSEGNTAVFDGKNEVRNLSFSGELANRLFPEERDREEDPRNFKIQVPRLQGQLRDIAIEVNDLELASSPDVTNAVTAGIQAVGSPESLNQIMAEQHWNFEGGTFELKASVDSEKMELAEIISSANGEFTLKDTRVINTENKASLPVSGISLILKNDRASLEELKIKVAPGQDLTLQAGIANFSNFFRDQSSYGVQSGFRITSNNLVWEDFIQLFDIASTESQKPRPQVVFRDLLRDIHKKYNPEIAIEMRRFHFGGSVLKNLNCGIHFEEPDLLKLEETTFGINQGNFSLNGQMDLSREESVPVELFLSGNTDIEVLNRLLTGDALLLSGGDFRLNATLSGDLLRPEKIISQSETQIRAGDFTASYVPSEITFPVKSLEIELKKDHAQLNDLTLKLGEVDELTLSGELQNLSALLFGGVQKPVASELHLNSDKLIWEDFIQFYGETDSVQRDAHQKDPEELLEAERKFKASLRDIYNGLNPRLTIDIGEFRYRDLKGFHDLRTAISFKDKQTLELERTHFEYDRRTAVNVQGEIDISDSRNTHVSMDLSALGDPEELNEVLNNDTFLFKGGRFQVNARVRGNIEVLDSLIAHSESRLKVEDTYILHRPSRIEIPIDLFDVALQENTATLNDFILELESGDRMELRGEVGYVSDLIFDVPTKEARTYSNISLESERLEFDEFRALFEIMSDSTATEHEDTPLRQTVRDVYNKYQPSLGLKIGEFHLDDLVVHNLKSGFYFEDQNRIFLEKSEFEFYQGKVRLDAHLDMAERNKTLFAFGVVTERIDVEKLLAAFDYFEMPSLQSAQEISGLVTLRTEFEGEVDQEGSIRPESLKGTINFDLEDLRVAGFEPIIESGSKIFKKERLEDIRFKPIKNSATLGDKILDIPLMEIQSTAFNLFLAGQLGFGEAPTNLWVGFPLSNLKTRDFRNVPDKKGYIASGKKVYVEAKSDDKKGMKYKLHLTPKKYYQERNIMERYRTEIREDRRDIRRYKRTGVAPTNQ